MSIAYRHAIRNNNGIAQILLLADLGNAFCKHDVETDVRDDIDRRFSEHDLCIEPDYPFSSPVKECYHAVAVNSDYAVIGRFKDNVDFVFFQPCHGLPGLYHERVR